MAGNVAIAAVTTVARVVRWAFPSEAEPAMDESRDPRVPKFFGVAVIEYAVSDPLTADRDIEDVYRYYLDAGVTPQALRRATSSDLVARVPVAELEARTEAPVGDRGNAARVPLVYAVQFERQVTDAPVPAEPTPLP